MSKNVIKVCIEAHKAHVKKFEDLMKDGFISPVTFFKDFSLSLNFGRNFGHTSAIVDLMEDSSEYIMICDKESPVKLAFGESLFRHYKKDYRILGMNENYRGLDLEDDSYKTILVDRSSFNKSNYGIIESVMILANQTFDPKNKCNYRIVILG